MNASSRWFGLCGVLCLALTAVACIGEAGEWEELEDVEELEEALRNCPRGETCGWEERAPLAKPNLRVQILNGNSLQPWNSPYCETGEIEFEVVNVGTAPAGASTARITFDGGSDSLFAVPALAIGASAMFSTELYYAVGDLSILIRADYNNVVAESWETDNTASGFCIG